MRFTYLLIAKQGVEKKDMEYLQQKKKVWLLHHTFKTERFLNGYPKTKTFSFRINHFTIYSSWFTKNKFVGYSIFDFKVWHKYTPPFLSPCGINMYRVLPRYKKNPAVGNRVLIFRNKSQGGVSCLPFKVVRKYNYKTVIVVIFKQQTVW